MSGEGLAAMKTLEIVHPMATLKPLRRSAARYLTVSGIPSTYCANTSGMSL
jgi:hypothetical protein